MSASTHSALNCVPAPSRSSANAVSWLSARRYERVEVMASKASATWMIAGSIEAGAVDGGGGGFGGGVTGDGSEEVDAVQQLDRHDLVALHPLELRLGETTGLVEELVRHDELADVVHQRGVAEPLHAPLAEARARRRRTRENVATRCA